METKHKIKSFAVYIEHRSAVDCLDDAMAGRLFKALFAYAADGTEPEWEDKALTAVFKMFKSQVDRNAEAYREKCAKNAANASRRGKSVSGAAIVSETATEAAVGSGGIRNVTEANDGQRSLTNACQTGITIKLTITINLKLRKMKKKKLSKKKIRERKMMWQMPATVTPQQEYVIRMFLSPCNRPWKPLPSKKKTVPPMRKHPAISPFARYGACMASPSAMPFGWKGNGMPCRTRTRRPYSDMFRFMWPKGPTRSTERTSATSLRSAHGKRNR